jgi:hypothetical protein
VPIAFPFENGRYEGRGQWMDPTQDGEYAVTITIADGPDSSKLHTTKRTFLKPDGGTLYEEDTTVTFTPAERNGFKIAIAFPQGTVRGKGYCLGDQCHYGIEISPTHYLESTLTAADGTLAALGSSNNKGSLTSWRETLQKQSQ